MLSLRLPATGSRLDMTPWRGRLATYPDACLWGFFEFGWPIGYSSDKPHDPKSCIHVFSRTRCYLRSFLIQSTLDRPNSLPQINYSRWWETGFVDLSFPHGNAQEIPACNWLFMRFLCLECHCCDLSFLYGNLYATELLNNYCTI